LLENELSRLKNDLFQSETKQEDLKKELDILKQQNASNLYNYNNEKSLLKQEKDKFNQMNNKIELITKERNNLSTTINELQNKIIQIENNYRIIENKYDLSESNIILLKNNLSSTQIELQSVIKSETSIAKQLAASYDNLSKQSIVDTSMKRIEEELILISEVEKNTLIQERDALLKNISSLHREMSEQSINDDQRCRLLTQDIRLLHNNNETITSNLAQITDDLIKEQIKSNSLKETNEFISKQFNISQERFENLSKTLTPSSSTLFTSYESIQGKILYIFLILFIYYLFKLLSLLGTIQMELDKTLLEITSLKSGIYLLFLSLYPSYSL
jgi:chromosome segregation ATPase